MKEIIRTQKVTVTCACCQKTEKAEYLASVNIEDIQHLCHECYQWFGPEPEYSVPSIGY